MSKRNLPVLGAIGLVLGLVLAPLAAHPATAALIATSGRPLMPAIAFSPRTGTYLLVWSEDRGLGTGLDLYAARVTASGIVAGGAVPLVVEPGHQSDPALAWSELLDSFLVVYTQAGAAAPAPTPGIPTPGVPGTTGTPGPTTAPGTPPPFPSPPGPPIPLWSYSDELPGPSVMAWQTLPPPPPPLPSPGPSPTPLQTAVPPPGATPTPTDAVPPPPPAVPGQRDVFGVWASESGLRLTNTFPIVASPADDTFPSLAYRRAPTAEVWALVWREVTGTDATISGIELTGYGRYLTFTSGKATIASGADHGRPSIALEYSGEYLVVWSETPKGAAARNVLGRRLNSNAWPRGRPIKIVAGPEDQVYPSVASIGSGGGYLVAWEQRAVGQPPDIRMRRLNRNGIPLRMAYDVAGGPPFSFGPNLPATDWPTRLLVWVDRNAASDHSILGVEITRDGRPMGPVRMLVQGGAGPGAVTPVAPPPVFPTTPPLPPIP